jgi:hypothetical protein
MEMRKRGHARNLGKLCSFDSEDLHFAIEILAAFATQLFSRGNLIKQTFNTSQTLK